MKEELNLSNDEIVRILISNSDINNFFDYVKDEIKNFSQEECNNYCESCLKELGYNENFDDMLFDTSLCSKCGCNTEVLNLKITSIVPKEIIEDYFINGGTRIVEKQNK